MHITVYMVIVYKNVKYKIEIRNLFNKRISMTYRKRMYLGIVKTKI